MPVALPLPRLSDGWKRALPGEDAMETALRNLVGNPKGKVRPARIESGLPRAAFDRLQQALGLPRQEVAEAVMIPIRTLNRRNQLLSPEADRVLRFAFLFQRALEVLGDMDHAREWLAKPKRALGGVTPVQTARTELGARQVEQLLGRIEHGVFS